MRRIKEVNEDIITLMQNEVLDFMKNNLISVNYVALFGIMSAGMESNFSKGRMTILNPTRVSVKDSNNSIIFNLDHIDRCLVYDGQEKRGNFSYRIFYDNGTELQVIGDK